MLGGESKVQSQGVRGPKSEVQNLVGEVADPNHNGLNRQFFVHLDIDATMMVESVFPDCLWEWFCR